MRAHEAIALYIVITWLGGCMLNVSGRLGPKQHSTDGGVAHVDSSADASRDVVSSDDGGDSGETVEPEDSDVPSVSPTDHDVVDAPIQDADGVSDAGDADDEDVDEDAGCTPTTEICNAVDDDCDGTVDQEGCECRVEDRGDSVYMFCWSGTGQDLNGWDAAAFCEERGYHLVIIESSDEGEWLMDIAFSIDNQDWAIGLSDEAEEGVWRWPDGTSPEYENWGTDEPNGGTTENCCEVRPGTRAWNDCHCETNRPFMCEATVS